MRRIALLSFSEHIVILEQDEECDQKFQVGDLIRDLSCAFYPHRNLYTVVGFTRPSEGVTLLWYTYPSLWIIHGEIRIRSEAIYSLEKSRLPWLEIIERNSGSNSNAREIFNSLLRILKIQYSLY